MVQLSQVHVLLLVLGCTLSITGAKGQTNDCTYQMDLTFVVDSSGSICDDKQVRTCDHWKALLAFIHDIVEDMIIGVNDVRVALIQYDTEAYIKWNLMAYHDKSELLKAIDKLDFLGYDTNTIAALGNLSTIYKVENGNRPGIRNTAILITDGKPKMFGVPYKMADIRTAVKKVVDQDIRLLAVGVTDSIDQDTLKELSSPPHTVNENVFVAEDYLNIKKVLRQLEIQTCRNIPVQQPRQEIIPQCNYEMDLTFVVDSSGSICKDKERTCDNWKACLDFMHDIVKDMTIGVNDVRVALILFESYAWIKWDLTTYKDKQALLNAIDTLRYTGGNTNTIAALNLLSTVFTQQSGDRPGVQNTVILITDGKPMIDGTPFPMYQIRDAVKRVTDKGTRILAVGVTESIDMITLKELSSPPQKIDETVFVAENYQNIKKVLKQLVIQTCRNGGK